MKKRDDEAMNATGNRARTLFSGLLTGEKPVVDQLPLSPTLLPFGEGGLSKRKDA
jgi:hypothetical protein